MAGCEDQTQQIVAHVSVGRVVEIRHRQLLLDLQLTPQLFLLALQALPAPQAVNRPVLRDGHEPGAGVVWHAGLGPPLQRGDERVLRQLLGQSDIAHHPRQSRDEAGGLDPPDRLNGALSIETHRLPSRAGRLVEARS